MNNELLHYLSLLKDPYNPLYYALLFIVLFIIVILLIYRKIFIPVNKKHEIEKRRLELDNLRIIAAFSESDPNPIIRTDTLGNIIHFNKSALLLFDLQDRQNINISIVAPGLNFEFLKEINNGSNIQFDWNFGNKFFKVYFYGIKTLRMARIYFVDLTELNNYEKQLIESGQKYRDLAFYLQDHLETEKQRIGLELHDSIGQNLLLIQNNLNKPAFDDKKQSDAYIELDNTISSTIEDLREIMFNLRPRILADMGLLSAVRLMADNFAKNFQASGSVEHVGSPIKMADNVELYLFRIIQESLSNILKHSQATEYIIQFFYSIKHLKILITDNGIGFDTGNILKLKHYGLLNMQERIKTLNGKMNINSSNQDGTSLIIELPYEVS